MCIACETKLSPESLDEFGGRFLNILNHGSLAVMISIGHRTGLFAAMLLVRHKTRKASFLAAFALILLVHGVGLWWLLRL